MRIRIRLFLTARKYATQWQDDQGRVEISMPPGSTLGDLLATLEIPIQAGFGILVNGRHPESDTPLADGDEVAIFPAMAGG